MIASRKINWARSASLKRGRCGANFIFKFWTEHGILRRRWKNNIKMYLEMGYDGLESINLAQGTSDKNVIKCITWLLSYITAVCMSTVDITHNSPQSQTFLNPESSRQETVCSRPSLHVIVVTTANVTAVTLVKYQHYYFLPSFPNSCFMFVPRSNDQLSWLDRFLFSYTLPKTMLRPYFKTYHEHFLPNPSQLISCICLSYTIHM